MNYLRDLGVFVLGVLVSAAGLALGWFGIVTWPVGTGIGLFGLALVVVPLVLRPLRLRWAMRRLATALGGTWSENRDGVRWGLDLGRTWDPAEIRRFQLQRVEGFRFVPRHTAVELARYWRVARKRGSWSVDEAADLVLRMQAACAITAQVFPRGIVGRSLAMAEGAEARTRGGPLDSSFLTLTPEPERITAYLDERMNEPLRRVWTEVRLTMPWQVAARVLFFPRGVALMLQGVGAAQIRPAAVKRLLGALAMVADQLESR